MCCETDNTVDRLREMTTFGDAEDFATCGVCLCEYDEEIRKPKFLPCFHTVCLECIRKLWYQSQGKKSITCPFCRNISTDPRTKDPKEIWILPNNNHALHIIKQKRQIEELTSIVANPLMHNKNVDAFFNSLEEMLKLKDSRTTKMAMAIQESKKVEKQLDLIMKSIETAREKVQNLQDENNLCLAEMISVMENDVKKTDQANHQDDPKRSLVLLELKSLFDDSTAADSTETLKLKMEKSVELCEQKLGEATAMASEYELRSKTKITVYLYDEYDQPIQTLPVFSEGFRFQPFNPSLVNGFQQDLMLLSHAVFSLLKRQNISLKNEQPIAGASKLTSLPPTVSNKSKFVLGDLSSKFILRLFKSGRPTGEIHIRPTPTFHPAFVQKLGDFCYKTQKKFCAYIDKALSEVFVLFSMTHPQFQPEVLSMVGHCSNENGSYDPLFNYTADDIRDVGATLVQTSAGKVIGWSFIFVLEEYEHFIERDNLHENVLDNVLFGRVVHNNMLEAMTRLSKSKKSERIEYSMTLESQ